MRFLSLVFASLFANFYASATEACRAGDLSLYAGQQEVVGEETEKAPLYGASMGFGNQCFPVWGVQLSFGAKLALEHSADAKLDGTDLKTTTVGAGPNWCFQFATGTGVCAAYLVKDTRFDSDEDKINLGSQAFEYGVSQAVGSFVGKVAYSSSDYRTGAETWTLRSFTVGLGYSL